VLAADGSDLAAALATINEVGDARALRRAIGSAFPDAELEVGADARGLFLVELRRAGLNRALAASELSDGTLRFLCLAAALLSPRPPELMALNEPETSLHPDLLEPLAGLITAAAERSQVWVTTHSARLADLLAEQAAATVVPIRLRAGRTEMVGGDRARWGD
jgi:predicted ATPase